MDVKSVPSEGATFVLTFPLAGEEDPAQSTTPEFPGMSGTTNPKS
jgi:hypothetical protein